MSSDNVSYADQTDIFDPTAFGWPVHLIGLGGIGSAVALPLIKLGVRELHIWDDDPCIEPHNIPAQLLYQVNDVGLSKVEAVVKDLEPYQEPGCVVKVHDEQVTADADLEGVVISGVDSMSSRFAIWEAVRSNRQFVPLYMDGRIGGEQYQLLTINPSDRATEDSVGRVGDAVYYETEWLFPDEEGAELPCAARTCIGPPLVLAGRIVHQLTLFHRRMPMMRYIDEHLGTTQFMAFS